MAQMIYYMRSWFRDLIDFLFPHYCWLCGHRLHRGEDHLCSGCMLFLPRTNYHLKSGNEMEQLFWGLHPVVGASAYFFYHKEGVVSQLVHHIKYHKHPEIGEYLGYCLAEEIRCQSGFLDDVDMVIPVPLHPKRLRKRGYNQSEFIARGICRSTEIPLRTDIVIRTRSNVSQTRKGRAERLENVVDLFQCVQPTNLTGKTILIVDDVCTTGATLISVLDAFKAIPEIRFKILTLGIASSMH